MRAILLTIVALTSLGAQTPGQDQAEAPTFRTGVSSVRVDVQVMDGTRVVTGLTRDDFLLYDNNQPQSITYFDHEREPVLLLLALDISGSMAKYIQQLVIASREALKSLNQGDQVGILVFARNSRVITPFTADLASLPAKLREAVQEEGLGNGTQINHALFDAAKYFADNAPATGRRAILIVTDNESINYQLSDETVVRQLQNANVVCNAIVVGKAKRPATASRFRNPDFTVADVFHISEQTGGDVMKSDKAGEAFTEILDRIRSRYSLHYGAPEGAAAGFREIRVELSAAAKMKYPVAAMRYRKGYYVR